MYKINIGVRLKIMMRYFYKMAYIKPSFYVRSLYGPIKAKGYKNGPVR